jgi:hypothetical protein
MVWHGTTLGLNLFFAVPPTADAFDRLLERATDDGPPLTATAQAIVATAGRQPAPKPADD